MPSLPFVSFSGNVRSLNLRNSDGLRTDVTCSNSIVLVLSDQLVT